MRKILRAISLLLLPILLYYGLFLCFEPNNFFGLRKETPSGAVFGAIKGYQRNPVPNVIIGDSRLAHLDMAEAGRLAGRPWANLAFGGASIKEMLDLAEWLTARYPVEHLLLQPSFYTLNLNYTTDRFDTIETALVNPFAYLTSLSYNLETWQNLGYWLRGEALGGGKAETEDPAAYEWVNYEAPGGEKVRLRTRIAAYLETIAPYTGVWEFNEAQFTRLLGLIEAWEAEGIKVSIVLPPMHEALLLYDAVPHGIAPVMEEKLAQLAQSPAQLLDYEFTARPNFAEDQFFDGFHLDYLRGLPAFTELLFADLAKGVNRYGA